MNKKNQIYKSSPQEKMQKRTKMCTLLPEQTL